MRVAVAQPPRAASSTPANAGSRGVIRRGSPTSSRSRRSDHRIETSNCISQFEVSPCQPRISRMHCPNCGAPMSEQTLDGQLGTNVKIDLCLSCQAFWFDGYESLKLTPASVLKLFRLIGEQPASKPAAMSDRSACPRCQMRLVPTHDMQRNTTFGYLR